MTDYTATFEIGDLKLTLFNDRTIWVDAGGPFGLVPRALWGQQMPASDENLLRMVHINALVQVAGQNILIDTGYGDKLNLRMQRILRTEGESGLLRGLAQQGLHPDDIHLVINTHLHGDHCGGNTRLLADGGIAPVFPNARHVVQSREYADAMQPNERTRATYFPVNYAPLLADGQMTLLEGDAQLAEGIWGVVTPGHTPGHMSVRFESGGEHGLFVCDLASFALHFERLGWMTAYDVEPLVTLETKRHWQRWALENDALLIFPHDPFRPVGRLRQDGAGALSLATVGVPVVTDGA
jgi:glyoxylase-like metal-dependent hydrolase (beta-lactamase superfamily II)